MVVGVRRGTIWRRSISAVIVSSSMVLDGVHGGCQSGGVLMRGRVELTTSTSSSGVNLAEKRFCNRY